MTEEKIPYLQCLYHTGKKVYKWWVIALAVIGIISMIGFIIASAWKQIVDFCTTIGTALGYVGYVLTTHFNNVWLLMCAVPWYWWVAAGVTIGPLILVAIWCALKHYNVNDWLFITVIICLITFVGIINLVFNFLCRTLNNINIFFGIFSLAWWIILIMIMGEDNSGDYQ